MSQHESLPREQDAPRWLLASLVVLLLIGSGAALQWLATSGRADQVFGKPSTLGHDERVITQLEQILEEPAKGNLIGREVQLHSVAVQDSVGEYTFWIGPDEANRIPVVLVGQMEGGPAGEAARVRDGSVVTIFGTVRATSSGRVFEEDFRLTDEQRAALGSTEVYIVAHTVLVESELAATTAEKVLPAGDEVATRIGRTLHEGARVDVAGRQVTIRGAGVQGVVGDYTFWIGRDEDNRIPVVLVGEMTGRQPHGETVVRNGDVVTIFGMIRATERGRVFDQDPLLDDEQRSELAATDIYIAASQVLVHDRYRGGDPKARRNGRSAI